jgi:SAM-dependent methyltransferase
VADPYYSSGADLKAKNELAAREGPDVPAWALAHLDLSSLTTALDIGAGWGRFGRPLLERAGALRYLVCADISPGMLRTCRLTLADVRRTAFFVACDVRLLPFSPGSFDVVMANHMLYELAQPAVAAAELARVLRRKGTLVATTYSDQVRVHLMEFHRAALAELGVLRPPEPPASFSLENGQRVLGEAFDHVDVDTLEDVRRLHPDRLTETYLRSGRYLSALRDDALSPSTRERLAQTFYALACAVAAREGQLIGRTVWAVFVARGPRSS